MQIIYRGFLSRSVLSDSINSYQFIFIHIYMHFNTIIVTNTDANDYEIRKIKIDLFD